MIDFAHLTIEFVTGPPRSGTTLMAGMMSGGEYAYPQLPECNILAQTLRPYHEIRLYHEKSRYDAYVGSKDFLDGLYRDIAEKLIQRVIALANHPPRSRLVLKDPMNIWLGGELRRLFPQSKTLIMLRDPRDIVASLIKAQRVGGTFVSLADSIELVHHSFHQIETATACESELPLIVRYESLAAGEIATLDRIENFLGRPIHRSGFVEPPSHIEPSNPFFSLLYGKPLSTERIANARRTMTPKALLMIERKLAGPIAKYGYA